MDSTLTMLMFGYAFGKPGFITDPLFDVAKNAMIHAHCLVGDEDGRSRRVSGTRSPSARIAMTAAGRRWRWICALARRSRAPSCAMWSTMLLSAQKIIEIPSFDDRGCRTQIVARVADAHKMLANWGSGVLDQTDMMTMLHRVVFYGNHIENVQYLAQLLGLKIVMEG